jgi:hypothetical protein
MDSPAMNVRISINVVRLLTAFEEEAGESIKSKKDESREAGLVTSASK